MKIVDLKKSIEKRFRKQMEISSQNSELIECLIEYRRNVCFDGPLELKELQYNLNQLRLKEASMETLVDKIKSN